MNEQRSGHERSSTSSFEVALDEREAAWRRKLDAAEAVAREKHARDEAALAEVTQCTVSRHVVVYRIASRTPKHARGEAALAEASGAIESK